MTELKIETRYDVHIPKSYPVRIGRAVDNDIVIRALGVADYHVIIEESAEGLQIRNLHETEINGRPIRSRIILHQNSALTVGSSKIKLWLDPKAEMPDQARASHWQPFTRPIYALIWFTLALISPLWTDFLQTETYYVVNWKLFFFNASVILGLIWGVHSMILPLVRRYLLIPLLGLVSALVLFSDFNDRLFYWLAFQFGVSWLDLIALMIASIVFIFAFRAFLRDFVPLAGKLLTRYTLAISLPCLMLLMYNYLKPHDFFTQRSGSFPSHPKVIMQNKLPIVSEQSIEAFLSIEQE